MLAKCAGSNSLHSIYVSCFLFTPGSSFIFSHLQNCSFFHFISSNFFLRIYPSLNIHRFFLLILWKPTYSILEKRKALLKPLQNGNSITILLGFLFTITKGFLFTMVLGIQLTISTWARCLRLPVASNSSFLMF